MKKNKYIIIAVIVFIILVLIISFAYVFRVIGKSGFGPGLADYTYKIGDSCILSRSSAHMITVGCDGLTKGIDPKVVKIGWDNNYLIAMTNPVTKTDPNNPNCLNCVPDKSATYWWILDLKNKITYGRLDSEEMFNEKEKELGIGDIELISVDQAKNKATPIDDFYKN